MTEPMRKPNVFSGRGKKEGRYARQQEKEERRQSELQETNYALLDEKPRIICLGSKQQWWVARGFCAADVNPTSIATLQEMDLLGLMFEVQPDGFDEKQEEEQSVQSSRLTRTGLKTVELSLHRPSITHPQNSKITHRHTHNL
eukprot:c16456_g1_i1 orf=456-884(+)